MIFLLIIKIKQITLNKDKTEKKLKNSSCAKTVSDNYKTNGIVSMHLILSNNIDTTLGLL